MYPCLHHQRGMGMTKVMNTDGAEACFLHNLAKRVRDSAGIKGAVHQGGQKRSPDPSTVGGLYSAARILYAYERIGALLEIKGSKSLVGERPLSFVSPGSLTTVLYNMADSETGSATIDLVTHDAKLLPVHVRWQTINYLDTSV